MMLSTRTFRLVAVMLLTQFGATWRVQAQEASIQHLKGLTGIAVHVGIDGPSNISMTQLESAVTQRLRDAAITIVPAQAPRPYNTQGHLWATVMVFRAAPGSDRSLVHTQLRLYSSVTLASSNDRSEAITWETERLTIVPARDRDARMRDDLNYLIDDFSKAYQSANPR